MDILQANAEAQRCFREMLAAGTLADPDAPETRAYVVAERVMDDIITTAQWKASQAAWDALVAVADYHTWQAR